MLRESDGVGQGRQVLNFGTMGFVRRACTAAFEIEVGALGRGLDVNVCVLLERESGGIGTALL